MSSSLPDVAAWPEISRLLDEALALPPGRRDGWLAGLAIAPASRHTLLGLLATLSDIEGGDFLQDLPHLEVAPDEPAPEHLPRQVVGPYRLLRQIGVGGMGTVWLAERADGHLQRHVALKLPRATWGGSFARRLARESRILATLEHDHIARLYDAGLDAQGRPFLALEYVEGEPIDVYCRERALPLRDREGLLLQTMAAVSHAHARLIVHRDLKPANILVTRQGQVKLLDFGIAKLLESELTEATALTHVAGRALTLDYASPEQIRGEPLGTGSDIYSLGVVAYELLAEARPYRLRRGSAAEIEEAIADADPTLASDAATAPALRKALRGDLDAILNRALKKSVDERYASVDAFAQDLQRHLRGEPVQARPDSRGYRVRKFVRRNRLAVALTSTLAASVLVGGGLSAWQALVAGRQERRAEMEAARQQAVRDLYDETMAELNVTANERPDAFTQPHMITKVLQDKLHEFEPRLRDQPDERAAQLEAVMLQLNYTNEFDASLAIGHEYLAHLKARGGTPEQIINAYAVMGRDLFQLKRYEECEATRRAGFEWAPEVDDTRTRMIRIAIASDLANILIWRGKRTEALSVLARADTLAGQRMPFEGLAYQILHIRANFHMNFDERRQLLAAQAAHDGLSQIAALDPDQRAVDLKFYGTALLANGRAAESEIALRESQAIYTNAYGPTSQNSVQAVGRLAEVIGRRGDHARATALLDDEARALSAVPGGLPPEFALRLLERRLEIAWLAGDVATLQPLVTTEVDAYTRPATIKANTLLLQFDSLALALAGRGVDAAAVMQAMRRHWPDPNFATADGTRIQETLALAQLAAGQWEAARSTARGLAALYEREHAVSGRTYVTAWEVVALASARLGDTRAAAQALAAADHAQPPPPFPSDVAHAESLLRRAAVLDAVARGSDARAAARDALVLLKHQHPESPRLALARRLAVPGP